MTMKPNTELNTMMFFDDALEGERTQLLTELADAVSETRTAADQAAELNEDGEAALLRLTEIWCAMNGVPAIVIFEGGQSELLANVVAQIYAHLLQHHFRDPVGLAVYVELRYMTASLMLGEYVQENAPSYSCASKPAHPQHFSLTGYGSNLSAVWLSLS